MVESKWEHRYTPLLPEIAVATDAVMVKLCVKLLGLDAEQLTGFSGVGNQTLIAIKSTPSKLPWLPGIRYFGADADVPGLYMPTHLQPTLPLKLMAQAFAKRLVVLPCVVIPAGVITASDQVFSISEARPLSKVFLQRQVDQGVAQKIIDHPVDSQTSGQ